MKNVRKSCVGRVFVAADREKLSEMTLADVKKDIAVYTEEE